MSLEICAAVDASLQKELAALRSFIAGTLNTHTERLHGDLAALLPAPRTPELDMPPLIAERRIGPRIGWTLAVLALAGAAAMSWLWWNRGAEIAALNTDLTAAYAELETLRARPVAAPLADAPVAMPVDPNAVVPDADGPDAAAPSESGVALVPLGEVVSPPAPAAPEALTPEGQVPVAAAPASASAGTTAPAAPASVPASATPAAPAQ
jgi:hypothetical protein